jgi:hypothetical protein
MATLEHNEQKLKLLRSKYDKLNSIAEAVRTLEQIDALIELADDIAVLETKVEKQRKKASVTQEEADEAEQQATAAFTSFVEQFNIYFTASSGLWWWHEHGEWHAAKPDAFREKFRGDLGSADGYKLFQAILDEQGRKLNQAFYGWEDRPGYLNLLSMGSFCQPVEADSYHPDLRSTVLLFGWWQAGEHRASGEADPCQVAAPGELPVAMCRVCRWRWHRQVGAGRAVPGRSVRLQECRG